MIALLHVLPAIACLPTCGPQPSCSRLPLSHGAHPTKHGAGVVKWNCHAVPATRNTNHADKRRRKKNLPATSRNQSKVASATPIMYFTTSATTANQDTVSRSKHDAQ